MAANRPTHIEIDQPTAAALWQVYAPIISMGCDDIRGSYERSLTVDTADSLRETVARTRRDFDRIVVGHSIVSQLPYLRISGEVDFASAAAIAAEDLATEKRERDRLVSDRDRWGRESDATPLSKLPEYIANADQTVENARVALALFADLAERDGVPASLTLNEDQVKAFDRVMDVLWWRTAQDMDSGYDARQADERLEKLNALHRMSVLAAKGQAPTGWSDQYVVRDLLDSWIKDLDGSMKGTIAAGEMAKTKEEVATVKADLDQVAVDVQACRLVLEALPTEVRAAPTLTVISDALAGASEAVAA